MEIDPREEWMSEFCKGLSVGPDDSADSYAGAVDGEYLVKAYSCDRDGNGLTHQAQVNLIEGWAWVYRGGRPMQGRRVELSPDQTAESFGEEVRQVIRDHLS